MSGCLRLFHLILTTLCLSVAICSTTIFTRAGETTTDDKQPSNVVFRRLFVPADAPETWPVGTERYLPIPHTEFSRLVQQWNRSGAPFQRQPPAHLSRCVYRAKLSSDDVLRGTAEWAVELPGDRARLLPMSPLNLAIESAFWRRSPAQQALLGLWGNADPSDESPTQPAVLVQQTDTLVMQWQLAARKTSAAQVDFYLQKPIAVPQTLELDLPTSYRASVSHAQLLRTDSDRQGENRWLFQLAPRETHRLRIQRSISIQATQALPRISQATFYQLELAGLNVLTRLRLDARESPIAELKATLTRGLRVAEVLIDQQPVAWHVADEVVDGRSESTLVIPRPESQQPQSIEIRCLSKFRPTEGLAWELPKLRFNDVDWTEGTTSLLVSPDLEIRSLVPHQATLQHIVGIAASASEGEVFRLQEWSHEAEIEIKVGRPQSQIAAQLLTTIELGRDETQASLVAELSSSKGKSYQVQAAITPGWSIDSVTTTPKSTLSEWHIDHLSDGAKLFIHLNRPISEQQPLLLEIKAHKLSRESVLPATVGQLKLLRLLKTDTQRELLQLRTRQSEHFVLSNQLERVRVSFDENSDENTDAVLSASSATSTQAPNGRERSNRQSVFERVEKAIPLPLRDLVSKAPVGILLDVTALKLSEIVELRQQPAQYKANIHIEVQAALNSFEQFYQIDCQLLSGTVSALVLEVDAPLPETMQWTFVKQKGKVTMERLEPVNEDSPPSNTARYFLRLPVALSKDFRLQASYSQPAKPLEKCNLIRLSQTLTSTKPDWSGQVVLRGALEGLEILDLGWTPTVLAAANIDHARLPSLGVYQLNAEVMHRGIAAGGLQIRRLSNVPSAPPLVAWLAEFDTLQAANGSAIHTVRYSLENLGTSKTRIALPAGAELQEAWLDEQQLDLKQLDTQGSEFLFRFDSALRWPSLVLKYSTHSSLLRDSASIQPVVPKCSFPVKLKRWTLWAPERYEIDKREKQYTSQKVHWWKRVFGPLARSRGESVFNPFVGASWAEHWSASLIDQQTLQIANILANQLASRLNLEPSVSLGTILSDLAITNQCEGSLYIDRKALLAEGITASTTANKLVVHDRSERSRDAWKPSLSSYRLAFLVSSKTILITTPERMAHWRDQIRPTDLSGVFLVSSNALAESFENIPHSFSTDMVKVTQWQNSPDAGGSLWERSDRASLVEEGRNARTVDFTEQIPTLVVRRDSVQRAFWFAILLLTVVLGLWQFANYQKLMIFAAAIAGAVCLIAPIEWLTIPQAVFLGLLATAIIRTTLSASRFEDDRMNAAGKVAREVATILLICIPFQNCAFGQASNAAAPASENLTNHKSVGQTANLPRVLIPIDSQGKPQGEEVYLSEKFLEKLQPTARHKIHGGTEYVLLSASYQGSLAGEPISADSPVIFSPTKPWKLLWKVESFVPKCRLFLPIRREEATWYKTLHRLDGLPTKLEWLADGEGCTVELPGMGVHWLQLVVKPQIQTEARSSLMRLHIPPLSGAKLDLVISPNIDNLQVSKASQKVKNKLQGRWQGLLEATDALEIHWNSKSSGSPQASWDSLEQRSWLHVDPATTRLEVQLSVKGYLPGSRLVELEVAPQLQLERSDVNSPIAEVIKPSPNQPARLQLKLRPGLPTDFVIPLRFELQRSSSIGHLFSPRVRVAGFSPVQSLFAVSVSAGLSYSEQVSNDLHSIEPAEFSKYWGESTEQPLFAYTLEQADPKWSLRVRPDPQSYVSQQTLRVHCFPRRAKVDFEAVIDQLTGSWLSYRIQVPESLQIDAITVEKHFRENVETNLVPVRWSRASATEAVVFLGHPMNSAHRVKLVGHLIATKENEIELPQIQLLHGEPGKIHMDLFRTEDVHVSWATPGQPPKEMPGQRITYDREVLFVGHYSWRPSQIGDLSRIRLDKNKQSFQASSVTSVELGPAGWTAQVNSRFRIQKGIVSRFRLRAPRSFQKPYLLQPEQVGVIEEVLETPEGKEITVLLARQVAAGDEIDIRLRGNLSLPADKRLIIPALSWNGASQRDRYVLLPKYVRKHPLQWQTTGLRRQSLPPQLSSFVREHEAIRSFQLVGNSFDAKESTYRGTLQNAKIRYTKVSGILDSGGSLTATAEFIVQPGRATSCGVRLPSNSQLYQLIVGDRPARRELREDGCWKVPLGPPFMPQRIVVSYLTKLKPMGRNLRLAPPKIFLGDQSLPAPDTWWHLGTAQELQLGPSTTGQLTDRLQFMKSSYQFPQRVLEDAMSQALDLPPMEGRAWGEMWQSVTRQALREWQAASLLESDATDLVAAEKSLTEFAEAFALDDSSKTNHSGQLTYRPWLPANIEISSESHERFYISDSGGQLAIAVSRGPQLNLWRVFAAVAIVSGALALLLQMRYPAKWQQKLCRWPHGLAVGGGFVWWLLLNPSALGLLVIVLALASKALKQWRNSHQKRQAKSSDQLAVPTS